MASIITVAAFLWQLNSKLGEAYAEVTIGIITTSTFTAAFQANLGFGCLSPLVPRKRTFGENWNRFSCGSDAIPGHRTDSVKALIETKSNRHVDNQGCGVGVGVFLLRETPTYVGLLLDCSSLEFS